MKNTLIFILALFLTGCAHVDNSIKIVNAKDNNSNIPTTGSSAYNNDCDFYDLFDIGVAPAAPITEIVNTDSKNSERKIEILTKYIETLRAFIITAKKKSTISYEKYLNSCSGK